MDEIFGAALLVVAVVWFALDAKRAWRANEQAEWETHCTTAPGMSELRATDWDAWADELEEQA